MSVSIICQEVNCYHINSLGLKMRAQYSIHNNQDHLRTQVSGAWTPGRESEEIIRFLEKVTDACRKLGVNRILAVIDIPGRIQIWDAHKVAHSSESFGWDRNFRLALVYTHQERYESNLFSERLAASRGLRVKVFRDETNAKAWLLGTAAAYHS
jgi:hypothetical protein